MGILCIGDPHFKPGNSAQTDKLHTETLRLITENHPKFIVIMGDILDSHEKIEMHTFYRAVKYLKDCASKCLTFVLIGNHDRPNNKDFLSEYHPFQLGRVDNLFIVSKPLIWEKYLFVPFVENGKFKDAINTIVDATSLKSIGIEYIFAHQEFRGAKMGAIVSTEGDLLEDIYPLIISGHIHEYSKMDDKVVYVGTPYHINYNKRYTGKYTVSIFDSFGGHETRIKLDIPVKRQVTLTYDEFLSDDFMPEFDSLLRIIVPSEIKSTIKYQELIAKGFNIVVKDQKQHKETKFNSITNGKMTYAERLYERYQGKYDTLVFELFPNFTAFKK
jgi:DNA repair exonuclease SbcCD nuclease subunit